MHGGRIGVDTVDALYVWEIPYYPTWYIPTALIDAHLVPPNAIGNGVGIPGYSRIDWNAVDAWFEEDEEVFKHPRDPYHRVDALHATRRVVVRIDGTVVADSSNPRFLFETGLPTRYYLPKLDVRMDLLHPTDTRSVCPYKGTAQYWSASIESVQHTDIAWGYADPVPEAAKIAGLVCFYNEKVDVELDGVALSRPISPFA